MNFKRLIGTVAATGAVIGGAALMAPATASADVGQCGTGYACLWGENNYGGLVVGYTSSQDSFSHWNGSTVSASDGANSVRNETRCTITWYDLVGRTGQGIRFSNLSSGSNYTDPDLSNGGGVGVGGSSGRDNWINRISSVTVC